MTFYLGPDPDHHDTLFDEVIDPQWLLSADPSAEALRGARQPAGARRPGASCTA